MSKEHILTLKTFQIEQIMDALIFSNCCDVCMDLDSGNHHDQLSGLALANLLKEATGVDCSEKVYLMDESVIAEDEKEVAFIRESFNIRTN